MLGILGNFTSHISPSELIATFGSKVERQAAVVPIHLARALGAAAPLAPRRMPQQVRP